MLYLNRPHILCALLIFGSSYIFAQNLAEKECLDLINQARTQPKEFAAQQLSPLLETNPEAAAMYKKLQNSKTRKAIAFDSGLNRAAKDVFKGKLGVNPDKYTKDLNGYGGGMSAGSISTLDLIIDNALSVLNPDYTHLGICIDKAPFGKKYCYFFATIGTVERVLEKNYQRKYTDLLNYKWVDKDLNTAKTVSYLNLEEKRMVLELNKVRQHPKEYIVIIENYLIEQSQTWGLSLQEIEAAEDLMQQLSEMKASGILLPKRCVYNAAKNHGLDEQRKKFSGHTGSDGSNPWDRIYKACKGELQMKTAMDTQGLKGNENLCGGSQSPRDAVIQLLIDQGIPGYGHRNNILDPQWKFVGCYFVGQITDMPNNWVQNFAR